MSLSETDLTLMARRTLGEMLELQGLPADYLDEAPFTASAKREVVGNAVPLPMGRTIARAIRHAMGYALSEVS